ncbi:MAG: hypothetical protein AB7F32_03055 [Victivallaceae bacterium]
MSHPSRIIVVSGIEYGARGLGGILLHRLTRLWRKVGMPDAVIVLGDLTAPAGAVDHSVHARLGELASRFKTLSVPVLVRRGWGDLPEMEFERIFPVPPPVVEVAGKFRLESFSEGFAIRRSGDAARLKVTADGVETPEGRHPLEALGRAPFRWLEIELGEQIAVKTADFRLPAGFDWIDRHTHTPFAYCSENMDLAVEKTLFEHFNLSAAVITEHSSQLCRPPASYWKDWSWFADQTRHPGPDRYRDFCNYLADHADPRFIPALEIDFDRQGEMVLPAGAAPDWRYSLGAIHRLDEAIGPERQIEQILFLLEAIGRSPVPTVAHPLRIFYKHNLDPEPHFDRIIGIFRKYDLAMEINFHNDRTPPEFTARALAAGLKFSFGSDSHNLADFGMLQPHIALLRRLGFNGDWNDILIH